ncbi:MAG: hypothetical protein JWR69_1745, partial [Pedosphaera sp.]|nr:hypothetical protein [Pedosphaera sp.]
SADDFAARYNPALIPTPYNLTAGKIFSKPGQLCFFFSADGLKVLLPIQFDGPLTVNGETVFNGPLTLQGPLIITDGNMRIKDGQVQYWDAAAFAADNTKPWRAHGVNNGQTDWGNPVAD